MHDKLTGTVDSMREMFIEPKTNNGGPLPQVLAGASEEIGMHYLTVSNNIRSLAGEFRAKADWLDQLAEKVDQRYEHLKSELVSAGEFENGAAKSVHWLRSLLSKMNEAVTGG